MGFGCGSVAVRVRFAEVQKRCSDVRKKATGKDFDAVMYQPHITMVEAGRIFGWSCPKFKQKFFERLSRCTIR